MNFDIPTVIFSFFLRFQIKLIVAGKSFSNFQVDSMIQHQPASFNFNRPSAKRLSWFRSHFQAKTTVELIREGNVRYGRDISSFPEYFYSAIIHFLNNTINFSIGFF